MLQVWKPGKGVGRGGGVHEDIKVLHVLYDYIQKEPPYLARAGLSVPPLLLTLP